jgi:hypothetical protein
MSLTSSDAISIAPADAGKKIRGKGSVNRFETLFSTKPFEPDVVRRAEGLKG